MTREEVGELLNQLTQIWPNWEVTELAAEMWWQSLAECSPEIGKKAFLQIVQDSKYPPTISEFRKVALALSGGRFVDPMTTVQAGPAPRPEGFVKVNDQPSPWCWAAKEDCVMVDGKWMRKVDFITSVFGVDCIVKRFKDCILDSRTCEVDPKLYRAIIAELVESAWASIGGQNGK